MNRVFVPFLLDARLDAGEAIQGAFDRAANWNEEGPAIVEYVGHISADGIGGGDGQSERENNFENTGEGHRSSLRSSSIGKGSPARCGGSWLDMATR